MERIKIGDLVAVINPIPVKKGQKKTEYKAIFPTNIVNGKIVEYEYGEINLKKSVEEKYFLKENDILLQVKGTKFDSILVSEKVDNLLAGNSYLILRVNNKKIIPQYLQWLLKTNKITEYFNKNTSGATIKLLRKKTITDLKINLPSIEEQQKIVQMIISFENEKESLIKYLSTKEKLLESVVMEKYDGGY